MKFNSSVAISALVLMATGSVISVGAYGQQWPAKPVRIIVPFAPGQAADIISRLIAERLTAVFGQQILVDNRPGAGSMIGRSWLQNRHPTDIHFSREAQVHSRSIRIYTVNWVTTRCGTSLL